MGGSGRHGLRPKRGFVWKKGIRLVLVLLDAWGYRLSLSASAGRGGWQFRFDGLISLRGVIRSNSVATDVRIYTCISHPTYPQPNPARFRCVCVCVCVCFLGNPPNKQQSVPAPLDSLGSLLLRRFNKCCPMPFGYQLRRFDLIALPPSPHFAVFER